MKWKNSECDEFINSIIHFCETAIREIWNHFAKNKKIRAAGNKFAKAGKNFIYQDENGNGKNSISKNLFSR